MEKDVSASRQNEKALGSLRKKAGPIAFTYGLNFLENLAELAYPWAIGIAINGLIEGQQELLFPLAAIWLGHIAIGAFRQAYDTRLFSRLNARMAELVIRDQRNTGVEVSEISARVDMIEELIEFLEEDMPILMAVIVALLGSLAFLVMYDFGSGLVMLGLLVPILIINWFTGLRAYRNNVALNTQWEKEVAAIADPRPRRWKVHFGRMAMWRIRLSDLDVASWSFAQFLTLIAVIIVLYRAATTQDAMAGDVVAILAYALRIEAGIDEIPATAQKVGRLIDIRHRVRGGI